MVRNSSRRARGWRAAAAMLLACCACAVPVGSQAAIASPTDSTACTIGLLTVSTTAPVTTLPSAASTSTSFGITGSGDCMGAAPGPLFVQGSGITVGAPTCSEFFSDNDVATFTIAGVSYPGSFYLEGPTASPVLAFVVSSITSGVGGAVQLSLSAASLQACLQPGGTTALQYSGASVFAL